MQKNLNNKWLNPYFKVKFYPHPFPKQVEKFVRKIVKETLLNHPFWDENSTLQVDEIKILVHVIAEDMEKYPDFNFGRIEYRRNYDLILLGFGLHSMIKDEYLNRPDVKKVLSKERIDVKMIDDCKLKTLLFHELGHVFDEANGKFGYSSEWHLGLSEEQFSLFKNLWNTSIDGRLSRAGFPTFESSENRISEVSGWALAYNRNVDEIKIEKIARDIWNREFISYEELEEIVCREIPFEPRKP